MGSRVLFVHPNWQKGGVEQTNTRWMTMLASKGLLSDVFTCGAAISEIPLANVVHVRRNKFTMYLNLIYIGRRYKSIVICQSYYLPWIAAALMILRLLYKTRVILAERNSFEQYNKTYLKKRILTLFFDKIHFLIDHIIFNAVELREEEVFSKLRHKSTVVINPRFNESDGNVISVPSSILPAKKICMYIRWAEQKNLDFIINASKIFERKGYDFQVYCGRTEYCFQKPFVRDAFSHMDKNPSIIFFCSLFEGYPNILLEARVLGLPVVFSNCPTGVKEILTGYANAFEFNFNDLASLEKTLDAYQEQFGRLNVDRVLLAQHSVDNEELIDALVSSIGC